jgi:hypothetical protein
MHVALAYIFPGYRRCEHLSTLRMLRALRSHDGMDRIYEYDNNIWKFCGYGRSSVRYADYVSYIIQLSATNRDLLSACNSGSNIFVKLVSKIIKELNYEEPCDHPIIRRGTRYKFAIVAVDNI